MEKNITIIDEDGCVIGYTYPKRAKGLVKKGRAEPAGDNCIMMTDTQVPAVVENIDNTEEIIMSKVIGFEARKFGIDPTCKGNNIANRMFVTDALGNNIEAYEIGDWGSNWTQISYEMPVEKDTDFEFLFAMTGDVDNPMTGNAKCSFIVMPIHEKPKAKVLPDLLSSNENLDSDIEDPGKNDWDNRYQYCLMNREYKPSMEKIWNGSSIRFYSIPFNTGDADKIRFVFVAFQRPYKIFPVKNFEAYSDLPDFYPEGNNDRFGSGWFGGAGKTNQKRGGQNSSGTGSKNGYGWDWNWSRGNNGFGAGASGWYNGPKGFKESEQKAAENFFNNIGMIVSNAVKEALNGIEKFQKGNFGKWNNDNRTNRNPYSERDYHKSGNKDEEKSSFEGGAAKRTDKPKNNARMMDTFVLAQLLSKVEDNGDLDLNGYRIEDCDETNLSGIDIESADNISISIDNASVSGDAFDAIMKKVGDNSDVSGNNIIIGTAQNIPEELGGFGSTSDNNSWSFVNSQMSEAAFAVLLSKIGDNCDVDLSNSEINDFNEIKIIDGFSNSFDNTTIKVENTRISKRLYHLLVRCCGEDSEIEGNAVIW